MSVSLVPVRTRLAYAAPGLAFALIGLPIYVHLPKFYGDVLGVDLALLGLVILVSRVWDAVLDPAVGFVSDRTQTRLGRRRPFILAAAVPLAAAMALLLAPPLWATGPAGAWWFATCLGVAFLAWTTAQIPHAALGAELTTDYHARTGVFALRDGLWILGTLVAAAAPGLARWWQGLPATGAEREVFGALAPVCAVVILGTLTWCGLAVPEPAAPPRIASTPVSATRDAWANAPFRILLIAYGIGALGAAMPGTLILYYVEHVLGAPQFAELFLGLYFLSGFLCLPAWTMLARRVGKKRAWLTAMAVSVSAFLGAALLGPGDVAAYATICVVSGLGFGAGLVLPASMVADVVDLDELRAGSRREGLYYGLWSIVTKLSAALGAGLALPALKWAGYTAGAAQSEAVVWALRLLYAAVPCACYGAAWFVARRFPLDESAHRAIRTQLQQGSARVLVQDARPDPASLRRS